MKHLLLAILLSIGGIACATERDPQSSLAGSYLWMVPGSTWTLTLRSSGEYDLTTRVCFSDEQEPIESGSWSYSEFTLILSSSSKPVSGDFDYRRLFVLRAKSGRMVLVSSFLTAVREDSPRFRYTFIWSEDGRSLPDEVIGIPPEPPRVASPNKSVEVTPTAVTPAADAPGAPSAGAPHH